MDPFHNWPSDGTGPWGRVGVRVDPGKGLRSAKVDSTSAPSAIVGKQELRQLINRPRRGFLASHLNRMELGGLIIAKMSVWVPGRVSCWFKRKRGRRWTETEATFTLHLHLLHLLPPPLHLVTLMLEEKSWIFPVFNVFLSAGPIPLRIREARVPIVNDNECVRKINTVTEKIFILPASSFCAGGVKGHDACQVRSSHT